MIERSMLQRRIINFIMMGIGAVCTLCVLTLLVTVLFSLFKNGCPVFTKTFFTALPAPPGEVEGGIRNAIHGSFKMISLAVLIGVPIGLLAGIYIGEFAENTRKAELVRGACNILSGTPTVIIGIFVYFLIVIPAGHFSGFAGAVALALIVIPIMARITGEMLAQASPMMREAAFSLGAARWSVTLLVLLRASGSGLISAILLTIARISGETAALLFTAMNSNYTAHSFRQPTASITVTIFQYALSPFAERNDIAWGAALLITLFVLTITVLARYIDKSKHSAGLSR